MGVADKVYGEYPVYFKQPIRWLRYHAHTKPHFFWSIFFGLAGPTLLLATPLRRKIYPDHEPIPHTYPLPNRPRDKSLTGFD